LKKHLNPSSITNQVTNVKDYLKSITKPKTKTKKVISNLLQRLEEYHSDLNSASNIKELRPSQEQRESFSRFDNQPLSKAMHGN
jgi:hypothetical protein